MTEPSSQEFMENIRQGIEASGRDLLAEARRSGQPLVTWRDGHVVLVDADGNLVVSGDEFKGPSR